MFTYSICDPLEKEPIEMGEIEKEKILDILDRFPWTELFDKMRKAKENDIYFSPSIEFENKVNRHGLSISIVENQEFYIFYKRPKLVTKMFGLIKYMEEHFLSERRGQTSNDAREAVKALIANDLAKLEKRWG